MQNLSHLYAMRRYKHEHPNMDKDCFICGRKAYWSVGEDVNDVAKVKWYCKGCYSDYKEARM